MTNLLSHKATLASVSISGWSARKLDRKESDDVNGKHGAKKDVARVNKLLVNKDRIDGINKIASAARQEVYRLTLPWVDDGSRILPNAMFMEFATMVRKFETEYTEAADKFAADYPAMIEEAKRDRMGGMFVAADYPDPHCIRSKFSFRQKIFPCPDAADFRVDLAKEHMDDIRSELESQMKEALTEAMKAPVKRIIDVVGVICARLASYQPATDEFQATRLYGSMVENVRDLVGLLPGFNLTGDKALTAITDRMRKELIIHTVEEMKDSPVIMKKVNKSADSILAAAEKLMLA